jgi:rSAM/selenodomain-associated transferase 1
MLKAPHPGEVKTRLAGKLGPEAARDAYVDMVEFLWERFRLAPRVDHCVGFTPSGRSTATLFRTWLGQRPTLIPQRGRILGERLTEVGRHAAKLFPGQPLVFIGGDCPYLRVLHLEAVRAAFRAERDAYLIPAVDGGYVLLAFRPERDGDGRLFSDIDWGTDQVAEQTRKRAKQAGLSLAEEDALEDVDDLPAWERARPYMAGSTD